MDTPLQNQPPVPQYVPPAFGPADHRLARFVLGAVAVVAVAVFGLWYFEVFDFGISRSPAAELTPTPLGQAVSELTARCEGGSQPRVILAWTRPASMERNALLRFVDKEDPIIVFSEPGPQFSTFTYSDTSVQLGTTYRYAVVTGIRSTSNTVTVEVSEKTCAQ